MNTVEQAGDASSPLTPPSSNEWALEFGPDHAEPEPFRASLIALCDGRTSVIDGLSLAAGAYGRGADGLVRPLPGPVWTRLGEPDGERRWTLDLRSGTLTGHDRRNGTRQLRFVSLARPGTSGLIAERPANDADDDGWPTPLARPKAFAPLEAEHTWHHDDRGTLVLGETTSDRATITSVARQQISHRDATSRLERLVVTRSGPTGDEAAAARRADAIAELGDAATIGIDELHREHSALWNDRWQHGDIEIEGDPDAQLAVRFALFHLLACADTVGEAPVGARGLTGLAYAGHVFWDTDVFVLPTLIAVLPDAARAVVEYRVRRLAAARAEAAERGMPGARFPWESADTGRDVTPRSARDIEGRVVPILTGLYEEHISSDVAWAALRYADWTGDTGLFAGPGLGLVTETAEYLAARIRTATDGSAHIDGVIGPDEYHGPVDDNSFTNQLARWHLRQAAALLAERGNDGDARRFVDLADRLVDGYDPRSRRHEQFAGYWQLDPLLVRNVAEPPVAADVLLGAERTAGTQIIKQPDVLMLHHLLPDDCPAGSLTADLAHYLPRTAHGSSLSPAICAALLARDGRPDDAMPWFDLAARLDLDNRTGTTSTGLHLATMGGLWQAIVSGFAGVRVTREGIRIDPHLPSRWRSLTVRLIVRGRPISVAIDHHGVTVDGAGDLPIVVVDRDPEPPPAPTSSPTPAQIRSQP